MSSHHRNVNRDRKRLRTAAAASAAGPRTMDNILWTQTADLNDNTRELMLGRLKPRNGNANSNDSVGSPQVLHNDHQNQANRKISRTRTKSNNRNHPIRNASQPRNGYTQLSSRQEGAISQPNFSVTELNTTTSRPRKNSHNQSPTTKRKRKAKVNPSKSNIANTLDTSKKRKTTRRKNRPSKNKETIRNFLETKQLESRIRAELEKELKEREEKLQKEKDEARALDMYHQSVEQLFETDLTCLICRDVYINPIIVNCSHSFCKYCIYQWLDKNSACPTCRKPVKFTAENLALKNIICKIVSKSSKQFQDSRSDSESKRVEDEAKQAKEGIKGLNRNGADSHLFHLGTISHSIIHVETVSSDEETGSLAFDDDDELDVDEDDELDVDEDDDDDDDDEDDDDDYDAGRDVDDVHIESDNEDSPDTSYGSSFYERFNSDGSVDTDISRDSDESEEIETSIDVSSSSHLSSDLDENIDTSMDTDRATTEEEYSSEESFICIRSSDNDAEEEEDSDDELNGAFVTESDENTEEESEEQEDDDSDDAMDDASIMGSDENTEEESEVESPCSSDSCNDYQDLTDEDIWN